MQHILHSAMETQKKEKTKSKGCKLSKNRK